MNEVVIILNNNAKVFFLLNNYNVYLEVYILFMMSHSLFSTLINLLGDAVIFVKQSASCVSLEQQFTELIFFLASQPFFL